MKTLRIATVCGMGLGTSLMLKMNIEEILNKKGIKAEISAVDLGSVKGLNADLIIAPRDMINALKDVEVNKIFIDNLVNKKELEQKLEIYLRDVGSSN